MTRAGDRTIRAYALLNAAELSEIDAEAEIEENSRSKFMRLAALVVARQKRRAREGKQ